MKYTMYSIQDVLSGFGNPILAPNEELMKRNYKAIAQNKTYDEAKDMRLFVVGEFDLETGEVTPITPNCIEGGIDNGK